MVELLIVTCLMFGEPTAEDLLLVGPCTSRHTPMSAAQCQEFVELFDHEWTATLPSGRHWQWSASCET